MLDYEDANTAMEWLSRVFGFEKRFRIAGKNNKIEHAELATPHGLVMVADAPTPHYLSPKSLRDAFQPARDWNDNLWIIDGALVIVDDVNKHYERTMRHNAVILSAPEDGPPAKRYQVEDIEGHRWMFMEWPSEDALE